MTTYQTPNFKLGYIPASYMADYSLEDRRTGMTIKFDTLRITNSGSYLGGAYAKFKHEGVQVGRMGEQLYNDLPDVMINALEVLDETGSLPSQDTIESNDGDEEREGGRFQLGDYEARSLATADDVNLRINGEEFSVESFSMTAAEGEVVETDFDFVADES